jgi:divalent metal cation (Fe/Co/Zn/Cd) transporter
VSRSGLVLKVDLGWWWADPAASLVVVYYAGKEAWDVRTELATT